MSEIRYMYIDKKNYISRIDIVLINTDENAWPVPAHFHVTCDCGGAFNMYFIDTRFKARKIIGNSFVYIGVSIFATRTQSGSSAKIPTHHQRLRIVCNIYQTFMLGYTLYVWNIAIRRLKYLRYGVFTLITQNAGLFMLLRSLNLGWYFLLAA